MCVRLPEGIVVRTSRDCKLEVEIFEVSSWIFRDVTEEL